MQEYKIELLKERKETLSYPSTGIDFKISTLYCRIEIRALSRA